MPTSLKFIGVCAGTLALFLFVISVLSPNTTNTAPAATVEPATVEQPTKQFPKTMMVTFSRSVPGCRDESEARDYQLARSYAERTRVYFERMAKDMTIYGDKYPTPSEAEVYKAKRCLWFDAKYWHGANAEHIALDDANREPDGKVALKMIHGFTESGPDTFHVIVNESDLRSIKRN